MSFLSRIGFLAALAGCLLVGGCSAALMPELHLGDTVIDAEETWRGTVRINGVVTVKKSGKLVIKPGTKVLFKRIDRDGDGIGDSELLFHGL